MGMSAKTDTRIPSTIATTMSHITAATDMRGLITMSPTGAVTTIITYRTLMVVMRPAGTSTEDATTNLTVVAPVTKAGMASSMIVVGTVAAMNAGSWSEREMKSNRGSAMTRRNAAGEWTR